MLKWASCSYRTWLNVLGETKEAAAPSETKLRHFSVKPQLVREKQSISTFQSLQRESKPCSSSVLYCGCTRAKFPPFDNQNRFFGASVWLWPRLTATAPKALKLFRSAAIHLLSSASGRLHPRSPTKNFWSLKCFCSRAQSNYEAFTQYWDWSLRHFLPRQSRYEQSPYSHYLKLQVSKAPPK